MKRGATARLFIAADPPEAVRRELARWARASRIYDGPDEVHKVTVARQVLKGYRPSDPPMEHIPTRRAAALEKFAGYLDELAVSY